MGFSGENKLFSEWPETTAPADDDYFLTGKSAIKKIKWSTIINLIKAKLGIADINKSISELNSSSVTQRIAPFVPNSNFTVYDTSIFYNHLINMVFFNMTGAFINGARTLGTINEQYRPNEKIILMTSNGGAKVDANGLVVLDKNDNPTGTVSIMGFWRVAKSQ